VGAGWHRRAVRLGRHYAMNTSKTIIFTALATALAFGCKRDVTVVEQPEAPGEPDGPMEEAGEEIDEGLDEAEEGTEEAVEDAAEEVEETADEVEDEVDDDRARG
jgi:vacuolar-type H+-ATPase subunit I/STV1